MFFAIAWAIPYPLSKVISSLPPNDLSDMQETDQIFLQTLSCFPPNKFFLGKTVSCFFRWFCIVFAEKLRWRKEFFARASAGKAFSSAALLRLLSQKPVVAIPPNHIDHYIEVQGPRLLARGPSSFNACLDLSTFRQKKVNINYSSE